MSLKVLSFNVGYFLGFHSQRDWLRRPHRAVRARRSVEGTGLNGLIDLIKRESPDVIALQEVDQGSIRTTLGNQPSTIVSRLNRTERTFQYRADCKYGPDRLISSLPGFRKMSNMICWRDEQANARAMYVPPGVKQLVHVLDHDFATVFSIHLPTTTDTRREQISKLTSRVADHGRAVVVGDLNLFNGFNELAPLTDDLGFNVHSPGETYPTADPEHSFDLLLSSPGMTVDNCRIIESVRFSDHLPIVAELS